MVYMGIDIGSTYAKIVIIDDKKEIIYKDISLTGWNGVKAANDLYEKIIGLGIESENMFITSTGYGRNAVSYSDKVVTEITCHACGATALFGESKAIIIDVGGQDTKIIAVEDGKVKDFIMNDKCAAGTGRFLDVMAGSLGMTIDEMCGIAKFGRPTTINSMCAVFAESEVIGLIGKGTPKEDIAFGIIDSIANKVKTQCSKLAFGKEKVFLTGGLSENKVFIEMLSKKLGRPIVSDCLGKYAGALGAAITGCDAC